MSQYTIIWQEKAVSSYKIIFCKSNQTTTDNEWKDEVSEDAEAKSF